MSTVSLTIIVPTRNEAGNVAELVARIETAVRGDARLSAQRAEVLFVDDSTDGTPAAVERAAETAGE